MFSLIDHIPRFMLKQLSTGWAWLTLIRLPNLLTVPGDVLAGCVLISASEGFSHASLFAAIAASLCFYAAGLIMNDLVDCPLDQKQRPDRPIASGAITASTARVVLVVLYAIALISCTFGGPWMFGVGVALGGMIFLYNRYARRVREIGALAMGCCRALNVVLGMVVAGTIDTWAGERWVVPVWWLAYVASLSWLATREVESRRYGPDRWLPMWICIAGGIHTFMAAPVWNSEGNTRALLCLVFATMLTFQAAIRLGTNPVVKLPSGRTRTFDLTKIHPPAFGLLISALIPMQAAVIVGHAETAIGLLVGFMLLIAWPLNRWLAKSFAPS